MFEVGFTEIVLILGLALLVLGPEKLPGLAQKVGRWTGRARAMARQLRTQLEHEVALDELAKSRPTTTPASTAAPPASGPATHQDAAPKTQSQPELDLDSMVSGTPPEGAPADAPADSPRDEQTSKPSP